MGLGFTICLFFETIFGHKPILDGRYGDIVGTAGIGVNIDIYLSMETTTKLVCCVHLIPKSKTYYFSPRTTENPGETCTKAF